MLFRSIEAIFGLFLGLVMSPGLSSEAVRLAVEGVLHLADKK